MITKLLLTLLVIVGCLFLLQYQRRQKVLASQSTEAEHGARRLSRLLVGFVGVALLLGIILMVMEWQDQRVRLEVRVINPATGEEQRYEAYRSALQGRQFTTVNGLQIQLSESERVEVRELPQP